MFVESSWRRMIDEALAVGRQGGRFSIRVAIVFRTGYTQRDRQTDLPHSSLRSRAKLDLSYRDGSLKSRESSPQAIGWLPGCLTVGLTGEQTDDGCQCRRLQRRSPGSLSRLSVGLPFCGWIWQINGFAKWIYVRAAKHTSPPKGERAIVVVARAAVAVCAKLNVSCCTG